jgi:formylglycine-generating enzyme required for sulfatase activity
MKNLVIESIASHNTGVHAGDCLAALTLHGGGRTSPSSRPRAGRPSLLALALVGLQLMTAASFAATVTLRLELTSNATFLVVSPISAPGALFILAAPELTSLMATPSMLLLTNTPLTNELWLPVPSAGGFSKQGFFRAAHWAGLAPALVDIPAGTFLMGAPPSEAEHFVWDGPQTEVAITYSFKMGKFELTQAEYQALMGNNPSYFPGISNRPVEEVSWTNAMDYCARLTDSQESAGCLPAGWAYRLPTEAEWEYACRAGTSTAFAYGPALRSGMATFNGREEYDATIGTEFNPAGVAAAKTSEVGDYAANAWGLFDMHGNVWEWCLDWWADQLPGGSVADPQGPGSGLDRVVRGGCWYNDGSSCRSACRAPGDPGYQGNDIGFRVVLAPGSP